MKELHDDALVIGFGKGGKTIAGKLAQSCKKVALSEMDSDMYGGTCINIGCIPSKSLITSAAGAPEASERCRISALGSMNGGAVPQVIG